MHHRSADINFNNLICTYFFLENATDVLLIDTCTVTKEVWTQQRVIKRITTVACKQL